MILYAVKYQDKYLRDRKEQGIILEDIDHCSVYTQKADAKKAAVRWNIAECTLIEMRLTEYEISWE